MKKGFINVWLKLSSMIIITQVVTVKSQDATSIISGLLSTFATSSTSPGCSGECRHMLSALFCTYIDENANCGDSQLRCCAKPPTRPPYIRPPKPPSLMMGDVNNVTEPEHEQWSMASTPNSVIVTSAPDNQTLLLLPPYQNVTSTTLVMMSPNVANTSSSNIGNMRPERRPQHHRPPQSNGNQTIHRSPLLGVGSPISVGTSLTVRPGGPRRRPGLRRRTTTPPPTTLNPLIITTTTAVINNNNRSVSEKIDVDNATTQKPPVAEALQGKNPNEETVDHKDIPCNGICISKMVASFCAEVSQSSQCSPSEACCLTGSQSQDNRPNQGSSTPPTFTRNKPETTPRPTLITVSTQRVSHISTTTSPPRIPEVITKVPSRQPDEEDVGGVAECRGSCVMGLLSMLCDGIDRSVTCANGGQCCISKHDAEQSNDDGSAIRPMTTTTTTTTEKSPPKPINCPGICLPVLLSGVCNRPAVLIPDTKDCESGKICCDNSLREVQTTTTTTPSPLLGLLSWPLKLAASGVLGDSSSGNSGSSGGSVGSDLASSATALLVPALAGLLSGSGSNKSPTTTTPVPLPQLASHKNGSPLERPFLGPFNGGGPGPNQQSFAPRPPQMLPPPQQQQQYQNNQQPQPNLQQQSSMFNNDHVISPLPMDQPTCTGTCIASFLKMTCFGLSHIAEDQTCPKQNLLCCAPKSSIESPNFQMNPSSDSNNWNSTFNSQFTNESPRNPLNSFTDRPSNKYVCGMKGPVRPETPRVVGGRDASPGEWCWQVALINSMNQYLCGGALIGRQWVLTAAHCVTNLIRSGDTIYIRVGDYDLTSKYGSPGAQTLRVATSYIHHNHNSQTLDNNIALLKLEKQVELKEGVCLVCLPARGVSVESGKSCVVTGYGYMGESGPIPLRIRSASLPIVSEQECVRKINSVTEKVFILPASSFCAGGEEGHDACQGDGGGPLSCEVDGYYEITGLVSWGFGCGRADVPGIYVKVSSFIGWINQIISVNV